MKKISVFILMVYLVFSTVVTTESVQAETVYGPKQQHETLLDQTEQELRNEMDKAVTSEEIDGSGIKKIEEGKGKFYEVYKEEIEQHVEDYPDGGKNFTKMMKQFDYQEGTFNCSTLDFFCTFNDFFFQVGRSMFGALLKPLSAMSMEPSKIMNDQLLGNYRQSFSQLAKSILLVLMAFQILKTIAFRVSDMSSASQITHQKMVKFIMVAFLLTVYDTFFQLILTLQYAFTYPIFSSLALNDGLAKSISVTLLFSPGGFLVGIVLIVIIAVLILVLTFSLYYSIALVSVIYVVGPAAIPTMINDEYDFYSLWMKTLVSRILTIGLQGICVLIGLQKIATFTFDGNELLGNSLLGISFLLVAMAMPTLLGQFGNSSGGGKMALGGAKGMTRYFTYRR